jgi:hypothetical protein
LYVHISLICLDSLELLLMALALLRGRLAVGLFLCLGFQNNRQIFRNGAVGQIDPPLRSKQRGLALERVGRETFENAQRNSGGPSLVSNCNKNNIQLQTIMSHIAIILPFPDKPPTKLQLIREELLATGLWTKSEMDYDRHRLTQAQIDQGL